MRKQMTAGDFAHTIHPHPTLSEAIMEAAMTLTGGAIHVP
jgi:dihydrolipoamide dehydrogenase